MKVTADDKIVEEKIHKLIQCVKKKTAVKKKAISQQPRGVIK